MSSFNARKESHNLRQSDACLGWHCLNSATRFGIIFSIVVALIILSIVWMYCAGRARIFRIKTKTKTNDASRERRERRYHHTPMVTVRPTSYLVPQTFVFENAMPQNFTVYFSAAPQVLPERPIGIINAHTAQIPAMAPTSLPQATQYPTYPGVAASDLPKTRDSRKESSRVTDESPSSHPTWWQRFYRAFNLPAGAVSTIASSPSPSPEPEQRAIRIDHSTTNRRLENTTPQFDSQLNKGTFEEAITGQDDTSSMLCNLDASNDSRESIRSDAATVHSDDFEVNHRRR